MLPALLNLADEAAYQQHFVQKYCAGPLMTHDGIPVYFKRHAFYHAFFESRVHKDDTFSLSRAQRIDWIRATLEDPAGARYQGWVAKTKTYDPARRVELCYQNFVVVLVMGFNKSGVLRADFLTCYPVANRRLPKVLNAPAWTREGCENALQRR